ncbi:DNA primase [Wolffia australiana]
MSSAEARDDVDRLFDCFKCGVGTPQSALLEKKRGGAEERRQSNIQERMRSEEQLLASSRKLLPSTSKACNLNGVKHISPLVFYGSPHGAPMKKPSKLLWLLREIQVDLNQREEFSLRKELWATFPRQEEAIRFARIHELVHLFSYQDHFNGQRRFLVCTYEEFWRRYEKMDPKLRHHYEVIQEGLPCHLYFDLEFSKLDNPERNADEMVDTLVTVIFSLLFDKYSIEGKREWIMELDSSTTEKFSRHLIVRIPQTAFKDNSHVGAFVSEVCSLIKSASEKAPQLENLFIKRNISSLESGSQIFIDTGVYSRNRCFRLVSSSKAGKNSILVPTRRFKTENMAEKEIFMESLICRMDAECKRFLVCKPDLDCGKSLLFDLEVSSNHEGGPNLQGASAAHHSQELFPGTYLQGKSPFQNLDKFVEVVGSFENVPGKIRSWYWFSDLGLMIYSMSRSRYCERIGREHKSNHVMYIVDFRSRIYYQKCYDPDCKGYRSPFCPLPKDVIPDGVTFSPSSQMNSSLDSLHIEGSDFNPVKEALDCCNKEDKWWQEALNFADHVESMRQKSTQKKQVGEDDDEWWIDAESIISTVEENLRN